MGWPQILITALGGVAGYFIKFYLDGLKSKEERAFSDKREHYRNLILCLKSLSEGQSNNNDLLWFEYSFLWLHAPDNVVKSANNLVSAIKSSESKAADIAPLTGDLLLNIRKDMGFSKTQLLQNDYLSK